MRTLWSAVSIVAGLPFSSRRMPVMVMPLSMALHMS